MSTSKHKGKGLQAYTANALRSGDVVYLTPTGKWSTQFADAWISEDDAEVERMAELAKHAEGSNLIVGSYPIDIERESRLPVRYREKFRLRGPTFDPGIPAHKDVLAQSMRQI